MTGWLKTLDGLDVYTEDGEWYWSHQGQGWFHAPGLLTAVPVPPLGVRARDEVQRLRTGWPSVWKIFDINNKEMTLSYNITSAVFIAGLVWMWVWKVGIDWGVHHVLRALQQEVWRFYAGGKPWDRYGAWYRDEHPDYSLFLVGSALFFLVTVILLYGMYIGVAAKADPHKGMAMVGAVWAGVAIRQHHRRQQQHDHRLTQDIASELYRHQRGGYH